MPAEAFLAWPEELLAEAGKDELWDGEVVVRHGAGFEERSQHCHARDHRLARIRLGGAGR